MCLSQTSGIPNHVWILYCKHINEFSYCLSQIGVADMHPWAFRMLLSLLKVREVRAEREIDAVAAEELLLKPEIPVTGLQPSVPPFLPVF